jgi:RNA polymerase sigma factor for flagellar operon FliA
MMPRRVRARARAVGAAIAKLEQQLGRTPADEEVAAALGVALDVYRTELEQLVHVTVGAFEGEIESLTGGDGSAIEAHADRSRAISRVRAALEKLDRRDALILALAYTEELSYTEIGEVLGVSPSRVCQLHGRAIARLRAEIAE